MINYSLSSYLHMKKSKLQKKQPCEDYSMTYHDDYKAIAIISDGHGDARCYRANYGSKLACYAALEILKPLHDFEEDSLRQISRQIVTLWKEKVKAHYYQHPTPKPESHLYLTYGATLSIVILTDSKMIVMNIGDGKCMVRLEDGTFLSVIPDKGISPDSLSDQDVEMDITVVEDTPAYLMLTSDGGGSFKDEADFIDKVKYLYVNNRLQFHQNMLGLVEFFASDDDVSMIWIYQEEGH